MFELLLGLRNTEISFGNLELPNLTNFNLNGRTGRPATLWERCGFVSAYFF